MFKLLQKRATIWLLISLWLIVNAILLCNSFSNNIETSKKIIHFYPFNEPISDSCIWAYDFTEFIVYGLVFPIILILMLQHINDRKEKKI